MTMDALDVMAGLLGDEDVMRFYARPKSRAEEVGYYVVPARQGEGIATDGARACRDFARARGVERLIAITAPDNRPSQRVAEKIGMRWERSSSKAGVAVFVHGMSL